MRRTLLLALGPAILMASSLYGCVSFGARAAEFDGSSAPPASVPLNAPMPTVDYLLSLGPYGALVWGAFLLGKGVKVSVQVELSERDRGLVQDLVRAVESHAKETPS